MGRPLSNRSIKALAFDDSKLRKEVVYGIEARKLFTDSAVRHRLHVTLVNATVTPYTLFILYKALPLKLLAIIK